MMNLAVAHHPPLATGWLASAPPVLTLAQRHWLFRPGALTAGLRQVGQVRPVSYTHLTLPTILLV